MTCRPNSGTSWETCDWSDRQRCNQNSKPTNVRSRTMDRRSVGERGEGERKKEREIRTRTRRGKAREKKSVGVLLSIEGYSSLFQAGCVALALSTSRMQEKPTHTTWPNPPGEEPKGSSASGVLPSTPNCSLFSAPRAPTQLSTPRLSMLKSTPPCYFEPCSCRVCQSPRDIVQALHLDLPK